MKRLKTYKQLFEKKELSFEDKLILACKDNNKKELHKLINLDNEFDYKINCVIEDDIIELMCEENISDYFYDLDLYYIYLYNRLLNDYDYDYDRNLDNDEIPYHINDENLKIIKKIFKILKIDYDFTKLNYFFNLNYINNNYSDDMITIINIAYEKKMKEKANEYYNKFKNFDIEENIDINSGFNNNAYPIKITIYLTNDLPNVNNFKEILDKHLDDISEFNELEYLNLNDKEKKYIDENFNEYINRILIDIKKLKNDNFYSFIKISDSYYINDLGGVLKDILYSYEWQEFYIDKYKINADKRYNDLKVYNIIRKDIETDFYYLISRTKFNI